MSKESEPAYPCSLNEPPWGAQGLTKRELFAAMAMQGLLSTSDARMTPTDGLVSDVYANMAVRMADALIAALEGK